MNEQLAAIKARREAVTPGVWNEVFSAVFVEGEQVVVTRLGEQGEADAAFIAAAPADIDTLLAEVERLTGERNGLAEMFTAQLAKCYRLENEVAALTAERDERSLVAEQLSMVLHIRDTQLAALTAERDALAQQLQQAQAQLAGDVVEPMLWKAAPPKRHEWDEDATTPA